MYCDEGKYNFGNLPVLIIVILLLLFCKDKDGFGDSFKEEYGCKECKPDYCKIKTCKKIKPVKKQPKDDECERCKPYNKPCKQYKNECKSCKPYKKIYEPEYYGKCIEDMAYYKSCDEYYSKEQKKYDHKEYGEKKCSRKKRVCKEKKHDNFMNGFSLEDVDIDNLDIDEKTMRQVNQLMKYLFK